ncbi:hypothetical protein [Fluoribacter dumoffii]|uniref:HAD hydrolase, family IB n=1 Tax=Fluoribacter dumoffii TaxID=463 RepID=A0A377GCI1_9GAMM|nr:hypothetical protein [Fluoribacter dumoffii]KTC90532.1 hypothetical protein Ldum_1600 [Fluoribacter dumoffii NY 23]STO22211.1 Uncharacterised protein [Fluoribacter dumoffii]
MLLNLKRGYFIGFLIMTPETQNQTDKMQTAAIFDFDGTITYKNTTIPFLKFIDEKHFFWKFLQKAVTARKN